jgi:hypothetical protein
MRRALAAMFALSLNGQTPPPDAASQAAILARMKDAAVHYADRLQDFLCVERIKRSKEDSGPFKHWQVLETQEREVGYIAHQEHSRLLRVNGKPPGTTKMKPGYFVPSGEFGLTMGYIFDPKSAAEFEWDHEETSGGPRLCVFRYRVTTENGSMTLYADGDRIHMRHHGLVYADCESGAPMRVQIETEPVSVMRSGQKIVLGWRIDVRYAMTAIAGTEFLLPQTSEETVRYGASQTKVEIQFQQYRKYESSSTVMFDTDGK